MELKELSAIALANWEQVSRPSQVGKCWRLDSLLGTLHGESTFQKRRTTANVKHFGRCWSANAIELKTEITVYKAATSILYLLLGNESIYQSIFSIMSHRHEPF